MIDEQGEYIPLLIFRQIIGEITLEEKEQLDLWRKEDDKHEELYQRLQDIAALERGYHQRKAINTRRPEEDMKNRIRKKNSHVIGQRWARWSIAAAVITVIFIGGIQLWRGRTIPSDDSFATVVQKIETDSIRPGETKAILTQADGQKIVLGADETENRRIMEAQRSIASTHIASNRTLSLDVPRGGELRIVLEDSTMVWLNSESRLTYPESFSGDERCVTVTGEAYFKVAHDEHRPFYVETDGQLVRVYGTEFNIRSYSEDKEVSTTLVSGRIGLRKADGQGGELMLSPGHQMLFDKADETLSVRSVNTDVVTSWRHGRFVFEGQSLEQILQDLSRWYSFNYHFENDNLRKIIFMGSIPRYADFSTALAILEKSGGLRFETQGTTVCVYPR